MVFKYSTLFLTLEVRYVMLGSLEPAQRRNQILAKPNPLSQRLQMQIANVLLGTLT